MADEDVFVKRTHPLTLQPFENYRPPAASSAPEARDEDNFNEMSARSFELHADPQQLGDEVMTVTTTARAQQQRSDTAAAVRVNPRRAATVQAAAARQKEADAAPVTPLTAEEESWGHWSARHMYNGMIMVMISLYQVVQLGVRQQQIDPKTLEIVSDAYMPAPPRAADLEKGKAKANAPRAP